MICAAHNRCNRRIFTIIYFENDGILFPCGPVSQYVSFEGADCLLAGAEFLYWAHLDGSTIEALYQTIDVKPWVRGIPSLDLGIIVGQATLLLYSGQS